MFRDILVKLPADSEQVHDCIKYFTSSALDSYLHSYEEEVLDSDISYEFHRESHHIHTIPRPRISQVSLIVMLNFATHILQGQADLNYDA